MLQQKKYSRIGIIVTGGKGKAVDKIRTLNECGALFVGRNVRHFWRDFCGDT